MGRVMIAGLVLLAISAPPLVLMGRELVVGSAVRSRYSVQPIRSDDRAMPGGALRAEIGGHIVQLADDQPFREHEPFKADPDVRAEGHVRVLVDGRPFAEPVRATVRLTHRDANRYWGYVYLMKLTDAAGAERVVVAQALGRSQFRTISVFADGKVVLDQFDYGSRCSPPVRAELIRYVVPHPSGYCSDVMQVWPTIWYPLLYPWVTGALGCVLLAVGIAGRRRGVDTVLS